MTTRKTPERKFHVWSLLMLLPAMLPLTGVCTTNITGHVALTADADWRGLGPVAMAERATLNLNEHSLKVDALAMAPLDPGEDVTSSDGTVTSSDLNVGPGSLLFDNNFTYDYNNHRVLAWLGTFNVTYDFGEGNEKCLRAYKMYFAGSNGRAPKNWTFEGSNDNQKWTTLDRRSNETGWRNPDARTFSFDNKTSYRYYKLTVSAVVDGGFWMELYQLEYFTSPAEYRGPVDLTAPDPTRVSSSALSSGTSATNLFDNNFTHSSSHRLIAQSLPCDIVYDFGDGGETVLNGYRIYYNSSGTGNVRAPFDWMFQGSNDNENWTILDIREGETNWTNGVRRDFWFANATPYRYYWLRVTKVGSENYLELYQLEYFCRPSVLSKSAISGIDLTVEGGDVSKSSTGAQSSTSASNLFDNKFSNRLLLMYKWNVPFNIVYDFGPGVQTNVSAYRIYVNSNSRRPKEWTFDASNDNSSWTTLDSRAGVGNWPSSKMRTFSFKNENSYRYYRLRIKRPAGVSETDYVELYQLEFLGGERNGELTVDVASETEQKNASIALDGALRLVKDGDGSFTAALANQTYSGGTVVSNGAFVAGLAGDSAPLGLPNGTNDEVSAVTVAAGGLFDANGFGGWHNYPFRLDGGTLRCAMAETDAPENTFRYIALDSDSRMEVEGNFVMGDGTGTLGCLDLGGHVLTTSVSSNGLWTLNLPSVTAGTIAFDLQKGDAQPDTKVLAWTDGAVPAGVSFTKSESGYYKVSSRSDGVYVIPRGFLIYVR